MATASALPSCRFASLDALTRRDLVALLDVAATLKRSQAAGSPQRPLKGANIAVVVGEGVQARSATFAHAARELGARVAEIDGRPGDERTEASARLLGQLYDAIDCEGVDACTVRAIGREAGVPVFDGLAAESHPARAVAALLELTQQCGKPLDAMKLAFVGDPTTPFAAALVKAAAVAGVDVRIGGEGAHDADFVIDDRTAPAHDLHRYAVQAVLLSVLR